MLGMTMLGVFKVIVLLDGQSATASVGSLSPADVMGLTGHCYNI